MTSCIMQENITANMAARLAVGATVRAVSKPRKFAARRAAITLVCLSFFSFEPLTVFFVSNDCSVIIFVV